MLMVNIISQLLKINSSEKVNPKIIPIDKIETNISEIILKDYFICSMNLGLIIINVKMVKIK